jgi:hypothetical protein
MLSHLQFWASFTSCQWETSSAGAARLVMVTRLWRCCSWLSAGWGLISMVDSLLVAVWEVRPVFEFIALLLIAAAGCGLELDLVGSAVG